MNNEPTRPKCQEVQNQLVRFVAQWNALGGLPAQDSTEGGVDTILQENTKTIMQILGYEEQMDRYEPVWDYVSAEYSDDDNGYWVYVGDKKLGYMNESMFETLFVKQKEEK